MPLRPSDFIKLLPDSSRVVSELRASDPRNLEALSGIAQNSKLVAPGGVFCALAGERSSGLDHAQQALAAGATVFLVSAELEHEPALAELSAADVAIYLVPQLRSRLGDLAAAVYQTNSAGMLLLGVTGTNGKTSTASFLQRLLVASGVPCGLSASTERIVAGRSIAAELTTPEVCELHDLLAQMRPGESAAAIEVSAQALVRQRVDGLVFDVAGFTNLSRDHLDDFGTMDRYLLAKLELFSEHRARRAVVFLADDYAREVARAATIPVTTVGADADWSYRFDSAKMLLTRGRARIEVDWSASELMARNFALALVMLTEAGLSPELLTFAAGQVEQRVSGRLELVASGDVDGYVDYAHTPAAIEQAIAALSNYPWVTIIFGASGNRDAGKRPEMAEAASRANYVVVTDQHPRDEDPGAIRAVLSARLNELGSDFIETADPLIACQQAISKTPKGGAVLWCGPGQLNYREVAGVKQPFSAAQILSQVVDNA